MATNGSISTTVDFQVTMARSINPAVLVALLVTLFSSCRYVIIVDNLSSFRFEGSVTDNQNAALDGVRIYFRDLGLDQWRKDLGYETLLGQTDELGYFSGTLTYLWGYEQSNGSAAESSGELSLIFRREGYRAEEIVFDLQEIQALDDGYLVRFELSMSEYGSSEGEE